MPRDVAKKKNCCTSMGKQDLVFYQSLIVVVLCNAVSNVNLTYGTLHDLYPSFRISLRARI